MEKQNLRVFTALAPNLIHISYIIKYLFAYKELINEVKPYHEENIYTHITELINMFNFNLLFSLNILPKEEKKEWRMFPNYILWRSMYGIINMIIKLYAQN